MEGGIFLPINLRSLLLPLAWLMVFDRSIQIYGSGRRQGGYVTLEIWCGDKRLGCRP